ncbi:FtsX-like permease family protein [Actinoplanes flavus]|uniref:ABC3 transporter permease C-terminal domain-containing protein n=1 Tax=Actinoplanes flavus TaxID=2820290 RepID=A0ABS3UWJ9_9ACTN|nr:FtsX-like permease family protein [Actinoplanes flavus]MBO3742934.1 hypothetical protein [Actinoplanes flavus]
MRARNWFFELALGVRMSVAGGRAGWFRLGLIAIGVGLGVAVLLGAATVPAAMAASNARTDARAIDGYQDLPRADDTMLTSHFGTRFEGWSISGELLQPEGSHPPVPPGVSSIPGPGRMVVSPALARLLDDPANALLRDRWDAEVVGVIGAEGLSGPAELFFYLGTDTLSAEHDGRIREFGTPGAIVRDPVPIFVLLTLVGMVVLLIPVMVFMAAAVRFGDEARDRRLAALRLVGADAATTRRIAAGETLAGAVLGLLIGAALWVGEILLAHRFGTGALSFYLSDLRPVPSLAITIVIAVPVVAVAVTLSAMRRVVVEPLGVTRMSTPVRRRLWWRLLLPTIGSILLWPLYGGIDEGSSGYEIQVVAGMAALLTGIALLLPWQVEAVVGRLGAGGPPAWQLAVRRLQFDSGTAIRAVSGIAVSVAGVIAMQGIVTGIESLYTRSSASAPIRYGVAILPGTTLPDRTWTAALDATPGVREYRPLRIVRLDGATLRIGDCALLSQLAKVGECRDGDVFALDGAVAGTTYRLGDTSWTSPATTRAVSRAEPEPTSGETLLITPGAMAGVAVQPDDTNFYVALDPGVPRAMEHLRNSTARLDLQAYLYSYGNDTVRDALAGMRDALLAGAIVLLVLIGASMVVNVVEQLRDRRRVLAVLVAFGTRRRTLGGSVLLQVAVPVVLGMVLAVAVGSALAGILMVAVGAPLTVDWFGIGATSGIAALVVLGTTAAGLPILWRLTRPGNLRSE